MTPLSDSYLRQCPVEGGFRLRGMEMTRIEVFVDAAFAFAVTMLVISFDAIPTNWDEIIVAIKHIPAFVVAVAQLVWIWYEHSRWSKRYGMEDAMTVFLSALLLIIVLVYVYPLRIMASGMFGWMTGGYLPTSFHMNSWDQLSGMFIFLGVGFAAICLTFVFFYRYAARMHGPLRLNESELYDTRTIADIWGGFAVIALLSALVAIILPPPWIPFSGFVYMLIWPWAAWWPRQREKARTEPA
ncbi:MAG: DUF1211 domain-containing protein [Xanthomonadales bacterium]|nr:DUF1211 domain-containing protein [Xanthomonadales bacterium]